MPLNYRKLERLVGGLETDTNNLSFLKEFINAIERDYFGKVSLHQHTKEESETTLTIDINCPFGLSDMMEHFEGKRWGHSCQDALPFQTAFRKLGQRNNKELVISEMNFILNDSRIVIKRLSKHSIVNELNNILGKLSKHFIYFTKGFMENPFEIHVPVFEDMNTLQDRTYNHTPDYLAYQNGKVDEDYYKFWAIYLESELEAQVYDVTERKFVPVADIDLCL
ncbi:hypothetical protein [Maribacter sp. 2307ULW6-5]|uniref:hypothetical protein n=1 Tax=Maribacter sp. 2307ULW6-5 TaxID=3386275 RepID=UPI0039BC5338